jgi:TatD DNase family protein
VIETAIASGVEKMLLPNIDSSSHESMMKLNAAFPGNCPVMMGLHPTSVNETYLQELALVEKELQTGKYIAVGEIGMDLYWDKTFREEQEDALRKQLRLAKSHRLPVSIHTREAFDEIYKIVKEELTDELKGIFHCFTGTEEQARNIIGLGFKMGIGGVVTFKNSKLGEAIRPVPLEHFVLETDSPFLSPMPYRGKRNQSSYLTFVAEKLAEVKGIDVKEVAEQTTATASKVFNLTFN